jgi:hypothetical protein
MIPGKKEHEFVDPPMEEGSFVEKLDNAHKNMVYYIAYCYDNSSLPILSIVGAFIFVTMILTIAPAVDSTTDVTQKLILVNILVTCFIGFLLMVTRVDFRFIASVVGIPIVYITKQLYLLWVKYGTRKE